MANFETLELVEKSGKTRGKASRDITYKVLNRVPKDIQEFSAVTGVTDEKDFCEYLFEGFNSASYSAASDEIGEYIPETWDKETAATFRIAVRQTSKLTGLTIEQTVNMLMPAVQKGIDDAAKAAAEAAKSSQPANA